MTQKKATIVLLVFTIATFDVRGDLFGGKVFKILATYIFKILH